MIEENQEAVVTPTNNEGEGADDVVTLKKSEYETINQTLGSLKRELKDLKKPKETTDTPKKTENDSSGLLEKGYLRTAGISDAEEVELALSTAKKWGITVDALVDDEDFKTKLEKHRTQKANLAATTDIKGDKGTSSAKNSVEYWIAKGTPPSATDVPDRKTRAKIARAMMANEKSSKQFYSD
jgi:hypothetical protein